MKTPVRARGSHFEPHPSASADGALALVNSSCNPGASSHTWLWRRPAVAR